MSEIKIDLVQLTSSKIIDQKTADAILMWYQKDQKSNTGNTFLTYFTNIGACVTGLWILLLIGSNWDSISSLWKTIVIIGVTLLFYVAGYYFSYIKAGFEKTGQALTLIWSVSFGAAIFLLWQIYNVWWNFSSAFLLWMVWVLPLAYFTRYTTIFTLWIVLIHAFALSYLIDNYPSISAPIFVLVFIVLGFINLSLMRFHDNPLYKNFSRTLAFLWSVGVLLWTLPFTFNDFWTSAFYSPLKTDDYNILFVLLTGVIVWLLPVAYSVYKEKKIDFTRDIWFLVWAFPIALLTLFITSPHTKIDYNYYQANLIMLPPPEWFYIFGLNVVYLTLLGFLIFSGIKREKAVLINMGIVFFWLYLIWKYFAFLASNKMDWAFVFITWWLVCIAIGWLWESVRRRLINKIKA